jgi:tetratricopeptide (TPR) repeat protein
MFLEGIKIQNLKSNPKYILLNKGFVLYHLNKYDKAIKAYDKPIEINPQDSYAWDGKGLALIQLNKYNEAIKAFDKAIETNSQNSMIWYNKGNVLYNQTKFDEAIKAYDKAIEINPQDPIAWESKGFALDKLNRSDEAIKAFKKYLNSSFSESASDNIGYQYYVKKDYQEAIKWYKTSIETNPLFLLPYCFISNSYRMINDLNHTKYYQDILIGEIENSSLTHRSFNQGTWYFHTGSNDRALLDSMNQTKYYAYYDVALTYYLKEDNNQTKKYVNLAKDLNIDENSQ